MKAQPPLVLSLGGSIVAPPEGPDPRFLRSLIRLLQRLARRGRRFVLVVGGGAPARTYMAAARAVRRAADLEALDHLGIAATRLNARLLVAALGRLAEPDIVLDPTARLVFRRPVLVAGGWKPGRSTDDIAVRLARRLGAETVLNLSNVAWVYDADPRRQPDARPIKAMTWPEFQRRFAGPWSPGLNAPFDPVAARAAARERLRVIVADGRDIRNLAAWLAGRRAKGTVIGGVP